ncbi:MAG: BNR-4 repeat-containing protein [Opitutaceae bacterium]|nr:BNR-4 repeat-containing protein [Opitutaceae bacterium]
MVDTAASFLLSEEGCGRATAYHESSKIITSQGRTHVTWLDTPAEGFRVKVRTLEHATGQWSPGYTIGDAADNHGGPALTIDGQGYLHVIYYSHHHPFRYRRSVRPNDASEWGPVEEFGLHLTLPAVVCAADGTLILTARRSYDDKPWELELWNKPPGGKWTRRGPVLSSRHPGYVQFAASMAWAPDHQRLFLSYRIYEMPGYDNKNTDAITQVGCITSPDAGQTWTKLNGSAFSAGDDRHAGGHRHATRARPHCRCCRDGRQSGRRAPWPTVFAPRRQPRRIWPHLCPPADGGTCN